ncbi:MAG: serine hydrolase [Pseudomonadota bacterium]
MNNTEMTRWWRALLVTAILMAGGCGGGSSGGPPPLDTDGDGIADINDSDDDNDGVDDTADAFPLDPNETADFDNDGTGDNADTDDDNDGVEDSMDAFPFDASESQDSDNDGTGDNADAFPNDPAETSDNDGDGIGDNGDPDDDNDGVDDTMDAFPLDPAETTDTDGDGTGNNADTDDDGDGVADVDDAFPLDATESSDNDGDGIGDNADTDDDNDGTPDSSDSFPTNAARTKPIEPLYPRVNGRLQLPDTPAGNQTTWVIDQLAATTTSLQDINDRFDPATLVGIPATDWQNFFDTLRSTLADATIQDVITMTPTSVRILVGDPAAPADGSFMTLTTTLDTGLIRSFGAQPFPLNGSSTGLDDRTLDYTAALAKLETLAEDVGVLVARIDATNQCVPIFESNANQPLATASIFKVWVVGAVAQAIEDGLITPQTTVPLSAADLVPGGTINGEPLGTQISVTDLAALMLGISDNTATEALFRLVGRDRVAATLPAFNHANPDAMLPFLSMSEGFHLYWTVPETDALAYVNGTEMFQQDYLDNTLTPLGPVTAFPRANDSVLVDALWQASPTDVCQAIAGLRQFNDATPGFEVVDQAYGAESVGINVRPLWERVWYKGGSLADGQGLRVLTHGFLLETDSRGAFVVVAMGNNDSGGAARIDSGPFTSVVLRLVDIVNETN